MNKYDRIEKRVALTAPVARVWRAITDAEEFGRWFGVELNGPFVAGKTVTGTFGTNLNEAAIVEYQKSLGLAPSKIKIPKSNAVFCTVERIDPQRYFSFPLNRGVAAGQRVAGDRRLRRHGRDAGASCRRAAACGASGLTTSLSLNAEVPAGESVLDCVLVEPHEWWLGSHRAESPETRWPGGVPLLSAPEA